MTTRRTASADEVERDQVDEVDALIISLIRARQHMVAHRQRARMRDGEPSIQTARETGIALRYSAALGRPGASLAAILIQLCRNPDPPDGCRSPDEPVPPDELRSS